MQGSTAYVNIASQLILYKTKTVFYTMRRVYNCSITKNNVSNTITSAELNMHWTFMNPNNLYLQATNSPTTSNRLSAKSTIGNIL